MIFLTRTKVPKGMQWILCKYQKYDIKNRSLKAWRPFSSSSSDWRSALSSCSSNWRNSSSEGVLGWGTCVGASGKGLGDSAGTPPPSHARGAGAPPSSDAGARAPPSSSPLSNVPGYLISLPQWGGVWLSSQCSGNGWLSDESGWVSSGITSTGVEPFGLDWTTVFSSSSGRDWLGGWVSPTWLSPGQTTGAVAWAAACAASSCSSSSSSLLAEKPSSKRSPDVLSPLDGDCKSSALFFPARFVP